MGCSADKSRNIWSDDGVPLSYPVSRCSALVDGEENDMISKFMSGRRQPCHAVADKNRLGFSTNYETQKKAFNALRS